MTTAQRHDSMLKFILMILNITLLVEGLGFPPYENIALNKSANLSSVNKYYPNMTAQKACDGNRDNQASMDHNSCIHTKYLQHEKEAWWTVDLSFITHVHEIYITNRKWAVDGKNSSENLAGFSIYVSNTSHFKEGERCFKQDGNSPSVNTTMYRCVATGRFVTVYNDRFNDTQYPAYYSASAVLELCEVEVPGCKKKFFAADCSKNCFCKDVTCDYVSGICDGECESGYKGISCNETCPAGSFGDNCSQSCPHCDGDKTCNNTGNCTYGCEEGYFTDYHSLGCPNKCGKCKGARCEEGGKCPGPCVSGFYSINCTLPCPKTCFDNQCVQTNGTCTKCSAGHFGIFCEKNCSAFCAHDTCNFETGHCEVCAAGNFGDTCSQSCPHCAGDQTCDNSGQCSYGCEVGYFTDDHLPGCPNKCGKCQGDRCNEGGRCPGQCVPGFYSINCTLYCPTTCFENVCAQTIGTCTKCSAGHFGNFCEKSCPAYCAQDTCHFETGHCQEAEKEPVHSPITYIAIGAGGGISFVLVIIAAIAIVYWRKRNEKKRRSLVYCNTDRRPNTDEEHVYDHIYSDVSEGHPQGNKPDIGTTTAIRVEVGPSNRIIYNNISDKIVNWSGDYYNQALEK